MIHTHTHTYDVQCEVAVAAHVSRRVLSAAVVQAVVVRTGAFDSERPFLVVDLMAPLTQLCAILKPLARWPASRNTRRKLRRKNVGSLEMSKEVPGLTVDARRCDSAT